MTFLDYLAASTDHAAQLLAQDLSGLADGANDIAAVVAYLRSTLGDSEAVLAVEEAIYQWRVWRRDTIIAGIIFAKSSPDLLT